MLQLLKSQKDGQFTLPAMPNLFQQQGVTLNEDDLITIEQIFHEFYLEGVLVPGVRPKIDVQWQSETLIFPHYHLTAYGERVVCATEYQPHDPDGYLARIKDQTPGIDEVIIRYLEECLSCFEKNLLLAAAVMLGCAAEKTVLLLIEVYGDSLSGEDKKKYEKETEPFMISRKWKALWKRLEPLSSALPNGLGDDLGTILERVFDIIRTTRNDVGHPTGKVVERETVHANLLLFPIFAKRVYALIRHFATMQPTPSGGDR